MKKSKKIIVPLSMLYLTMAVTQPAHAYQDQSTANNYTYSNADEYYDEEQTDVVEDESNDYYGDYYIDDAYISDEAETESDDSIDDYIVKPETPKEIDDEKYKYDKYLLPDTYFLNPEINLGLFSGGNGSQANPFILSSRDDLIKLGQLSSGTINSPTGNPAHNVYFFNNASYRMAADIDMSFYLGFMPIGFMHTNGFTGHFDGAGFAIRNLVIDFNTTIIPLTVQNFQGVGLFSFTQNASIRNLTLDNVDVNVLGHPRNNVGGLVGFANRTIIDNVTLRNVGINAPVANRVGGLVGHAEVNSVFDNITATNLNVLGNTETGGIVGHALHTDLTNIGVSGNVRSQTTRTGGLVGHLDTTAQVRDIQFVGNVTGTDDTGGVIGRVGTAVTIGQAEVEGTVSGTNNTGGVVGFINNNTNILDAQVTGSVQGASQVGGIFGSINAADSVVTHNRNLAFNGDVTGVNNVGGIGGLSLHQGGSVRRITNSYTVGRISGNNNIGGIVGELRSTSATSSLNMLITDTYSHAEVAGSANVGGIVGLAGRRIEISRNYVYSTLTGTTNVGGLIGHAYGSGSNVAVTNNLVIAHITVPGAGHGAIVAGTVTGTGAFTNNFYSSHSVIMGGTVADWSRATMVFDRELSLPNWWNNTLLINQNNAFDTMAVQRGILPQVRQLNSTDWVANQDDRSFFVGSQAPELTRLQHVEGTLAYGYVYITAHGNFAQDIDGLIPLLNRDFWILGERIRFAPEFLAGLELGTHRFVVSFTGGVRVNLFIDVVEEETNRFLEQTVVATMIPRDLSPFPEIISMPAWEIIGLFHYVSEYAVQTVVGTHTENLVHSSGTFMYFELSMGDRPEPTSRVFVVTFSDGMTETITLVIPPVE